jgi:DNA-binding HxlR family transcriptional regulator
METLEMLQYGPMRFSWLKERLKKPNKTIYETLRDFEDAGYVQKGYDGIYFLTHEGQNALMKGRLFLFPFRCPTAIS